MPESPSAEGNPTGLYPLLEELDRLEELIEEMDDLGVNSREDIERRLAELHDEVSQITGESPQQEP